MAYRTLNFRDNVLHAIAYKIGLDPTKEFLDDQARSIASYVNAWVRRLWDAIDWPEWTIIAAFVPASHVVPYSSLGATDVSDIGKVFKVYLVDPRTVPSYAAFDTPFRLQQNGIHVGFEHGISVWIKYIAPVPRFTADEWDASRIYQKDEVSYVAGVGECYKSKTNSNRGHNPPGDVTVNQSLNTEITQEATPGNSGMPTRPEIMVIDFKSASPGPPPSDPPDAGTDFYIDLFENQNVILADNLHTADGIETLGDIITAMASALQTAAGGTYTCTPDVIAKTITVQNTSYFFTARPFWNLTGDIHFLKWNITQNYIPGLTATTGDKQMTTLMLASTDVVPGAVYSLTFIDPAGDQHIVEYTSLDTDGGAQVLAGLIVAIETAAAGDDFFETVSINFDPTSLSMVFSTNQNVSIDATMQPAGSAFWELVPFPFALVDQVVDGAYMDVLKEQGQAEKAQAETQSVATDTQIRTSSFQAPQFDPLTDQQKPKSRYSVQ